MVATFRRARNGRVAASFGPDEHRVLRHVLTEMRELLGDDSATAAGGEDDPLARALGIGTATEAPADPALARLFPDGYTDDPQAAADFRRYTEPGLRSAKQVRLETALTTLGDQPGKVTLDAAQAEAWLGALTDTRLVLGERLGVTEDLDELVGSLDEDDPRLPLLWVYDRLTYLQETLVHALWSAS